MGSKIHHPKHWNDIGHWPLYEGVLGNGDVKAVTRRFAGCKAVLDVATLILPLTQLRHESRKSRKHATSEEGHKSNCLISSGLEWLNPVAGTPAAPDSGAKLPTQAQGNLCKVERWHLSVHLSNGSYPDHENTFSQLGT